MFLASLWSSLHANFPIPSLSVPAEDMKYLCLCESPVYTKHLHCYLRPVLYYITKCYPVMVLSALFFLSFCSNVKKYSQWEWQKNRDKTSTNKQNHSTQHKITLHKGKGAERHTNPETVYISPTHASYEHHCVYFYTECCQCLLSSVYLISSDKKNTGFIQGTHALSDSMSTQRSNSVVTIEIYIIISDTAYMMI